MRHPGLRLRFINRDSIEEQGGLNLYAFVCNNAVNAYDVLGRDGLWGPDPNGGSNWVSLDGMDGLDRQNADTATMAANKEGVEHDPKNTDGGDMDRWGAWNAVSLVQAMGGNASWSSTGVLSLTLSKNNAYDLGSALKSLGISSTVDGQAAQHMQVGQVTIGPFLSPLTGGPLYAANTNDPAQLAALGTTPPPSTTAIFGGKASVYVSSQGHQTAYKGYTYDKNTMTAAMPSDLVKPGTIVTVEYYPADVSQARTIQVIVNDNGPWAVDDHGHAIEPLERNPDRVIDLTPAAMEALTGKAHNLVDVVVSFPSPTNQTLYFPRVNGSPTKTP